MTIDSTDLLQMSFREMPVVENKLQNQYHVSLKDFKYGATFYRHDGADQFSRCCVYNDDHPLMLEITKRLAIDGKLFVSRNRPWEPITR